MSESPLQEQTNQKKEQKPPTTSPPKKKKRNFKLPRRMFLGLIGVIALFVVIFIISAASNLPSLSEIENPNSNLSTQLISADGYVLQNFYTDQNRISVNLNQVSPHLINALIATEDSRFYGHSGVDPIAPFSIIKDIILRGRVRGGSTVTQQLARNLYDKKVGRDRSATRKLKEMIVSWILERKFTKQEILQAYLNTVNIYGDAFGIEVASNRLYDKSAKNLNLEEAALMVAMLKGQGVYHPYRRVKAATDRRNTVLTLMEQHKFLNADSLDIDSVKQIPLSNSLAATQEQDHIKGLAPYFREHVRKKMQKWCKENGYNLYTDGLRVYTTLDSRMQEHAEYAVREHLTVLQGQMDKHIKGREPYKKDPTILTRLQRQSYRHIAAKRAKKSAAEIKKEFETPRKMRIFNWNGEIDTTMSPMDSIRYYSKYLEVGVMSVDPKTGHIKAWVGGPNYKHFKYDHVATGARQVGSTFKPFFYATVFKNELKKPCDIVLENRVTFDLPDGSKWQPKNSDGSVGGRISLRRGLATSANLVTAQLLKSLNEDGFGVENVVNLAHEMGIESPIDAVPSLILGTAELKLIELTNAYATFANKGNWVEPIMITRIEDRNGNVIEQFVPDTRTALDEKTAFTMVELLRGVVDEPGGTAGRLRFRYKFENEIGGKTGTTQNQSDGWFMGITPNLVTGVWVGCAERQMRFRSLKLGQGANMALPIWGLYMQDVYEDKAIGLPKDHFERPKGYNVNFNCGPTSIGEDEVEQKEPENVGDFDKYDS